MDLLSRLRWVIEGTGIYGLRISEKAVLFYVAYRDGVGEGCCAGTERIARELGTSERTARRCLDTLVVKGLVSESPSPGKVTTYFLTPAKQAPTRFGTPANGTPANGTRTEKEQDLSHQEDISSSHSMERAGARARGKVEANGTPSEWIGIWNEIAGEVEGLHVVRVFSRDSEKKLLERAAKCGLDRDGLEAALRERLPRLSVKAREWVKLSWLATQQRAGLEKLLNGDYEGTNGFHNNGTDDDSPIVLTCEGELRHARR